MKKVIKTTLSVLLVIIVILSAAGWYFCSVGVKRPYAVEALAAPAAGAEALEITSADGLRLRSYIYDAREESHKWALVVHGYNSRAFNMQDYAYAFVGQGFNVLTPDLRAHGQSEGNYIGMGWLDRKDMLLWLDEITRRDPDAEIALFGVSMGGATVMMTTGESGLPANVVCAVEDCGYTSVWDEFAYQAKQMYSLPKFPVLYAADLMCGIRAGYYFREASSIRQVQKSHTPTLFIHGGADDYVPTEMVYRVYEAAACEKDIYIVEGAGHGAAADVGRTEYWKKVFEFVGKYVG